MNFTLEGWATGAEVQRLSIESVDQRLSSLVQALVLGACFALLKDLA